MEVNQYKQQVWNFWTTRVSNQGENDLVLKRIILYRFIVFDSDTDGKNQALQCREKRDFGSCAESSEVIAQLGILRLSEVSIKSQKSFFLKLIRFY